MKRINSLRQATILLVVIVTTTLRPVQAQTPSSFPNCRIGASGVFAPYVGDYDMQSLNLGLYMDWITRADPVAEAGLPPNIEYIQTVRLHQNKVGGWDSPYVVPHSYRVSPSLAGLANRVAAAPPGSIWRLGNEIERRDWDGGRQDEILPELYATAFHEIRQVIKAADPTAKIANGSVIQPTPLRLEYLDRVWDSYYDQYGYSMGRDIDVWIIHSFILREVKDSWGAEIPAGLDAEGGFLVGVDESIVMAAHHNIDVFKYFVESFRTWMMEKGQRNKPLLITEYGILMDSWAVSNEQARAYMLATHDFMFTAVDDEIGYPVDDNKLVQGWVWWSLNKSLVGDLYDEDTKTLTMVGESWQDYVSDPAKPWASLPQQNLLPVNLRTIPEYYVEPAGPVTFTLRADIANNGNTRTTTGGRLAVTFWDAEPDRPQARQIGPTQILDDIPGCSVWLTGVEVEWPNRTAAENEWFVKVEPAAGEVDIADNIASGTGYIYETFQAELSVAKSVSQANPVEGQDEIDYTVTVANAGPDPALEVVVRDSLPAGLTLTAYRSTQGAYSKTTGAWLVGRLEPQATATLTLTAQVDRGQAGKTIVNTAAISSSDSVDSTPDDNSAAVSILPRPLYPTHFPIIFKSDP